jgi:hypothetical protein
MAGDYPLYGRITHGSIQNQPRAIRRLGRNQKLSRLNEQAHPYYRSLERDK